MEDFKSILSVISTMCAILFGYLAFARNKTTDTERKAENSATMYTEIGYIKSNTDEIKSEQKEQRKVNSEILIRLTAVENKTDEAHNRIDRVEKLFSGADILHDFNSKK